MDHTTAKSRIILSLSMANQGVYRFADGRFTFLIRDLKKLHLLANFFFPKQRRKKGRKIVLLSVCLLVLVFFFFFSSFFFLFLLLFLSV